MPRKLVAAIVLAAVFASFAFSLEMIRRLVGWGSPWFGLAAMLDVVGCVAVARPLFLLRMPRFLRTPRAWESRGTAYKALRVPEFGALLRRTPLRYLNTFVYLGRDRDRTAVLAQLESAEAAHLIAALVLAPYIVLAHLRGSVGAAAALWALQIAFNVYPMLHLRWARARMLRLPVAR